MLSSLLTGPGLKILAAATIAAALFGAGYRTSSHFAHVREVERIVAEQAAATALAEADARVTTLIVERQLAAERKAEVVTRTIKETVHEYVTVQSDAACAVPAGFVRLHDAAAQGQLPENASGTDAAPSGVALSAVAETVTGNYGTCLAIRRQLINLQDLLRAYETIRDDAR